jgi:hypothetical protein
MLGPAMERSHKTSNTPEKFRALTAELVQSVAPGR